MIRKYFLWSIAILAGAIFVLWITLYILACIPYDSYTESAAPKGKARELYDAKSTHDKGVGKGVIVFFEESYNWAHYKVKDGSKMYDLYDQLDHGAGHSTTNRIGDKVEFTYYDNVLDFMKRVDN